MPSMADEFAFGGEIAWRPTPEYRERSRLAAFMARHGIANYDDLLRRSIEDPEWFWPAVFDDLGIEFYDPTVSFSTPPAASRGHAGASAARSTSSTTAWTSGSARRSNDKAALRWEGEEALTRALTYGELYADVNRCANALRELGVRKGRSRGAVHADVPGADRRVFRHDQARRRRTAAVLRLRRRCRSGAVRDAEATRPRHRRRLLAARSDGRDEGNRRSRGRDGTLGPPCRRGLHGIGIDVPLIDGRDHRWPDLVTRNRIAATR